MAIYSKRVKKKITSPSTWPMNIFIAGLGPGKAPTSRRERENGDKSIGYEHDTPPADRDQSTLPIFSCTTLAGSLAGGPAHLPPESIPTSSASQLTTEAEKKRRKKSISIPIPIPIHPSRRRAAWRRRGPVAMGTSSPEMAAALLLVMAALAGVAAGGDIVHQDDEAPKIPGCSNDFVLVRPFPDFLPSRLRGFFACP